MKTLIYQYWLGERPAYSELSKSMFQEYAKKVGADYRFDADPDFFKGRYGKFYHALRPLYDKEFQKYDRVLYVDMDIFPAKDLDMNVFDLDIGFMAMAQEKHQPAMREKISINRINNKNDVRWAKILKRLYKSELPVDSEARPLVYNAGVLLYSKEGMKYCAKNLPHYKFYVWAMRLFRMPKFYRNDQNYIHAMMFRDGFQLTELSTDWNSIVHEVHNEKGERVLNDTRTADTKFIHMQARRRTLVDNEGLLELIYDY